MRNFTLLFVEFKKKNPVILIKQWYVKNPRLVRIIEFRILVRISMIHGIIEIGILDKVGGFGILSSI